ncbi:hypothetical protein [Pedobacter sp. MW01-1-1]|uniref:hypothetical protein n=1 Tax=Pedobacter sp. MW01-1-1 TaxID=3383027 RepID=UPI003FEFE8B6
MKRFVYQLGFKLIVLASMSMAISSCKKEDNQPTEPARIFKPSEVKVTTGETAAVITWATPIMASGKLKYSVDISTDSLFNTVSYTTTADTTGTIVTDENMAVRTKYFARIKALATSTQPESKYVVSSSFQISGKQFFLPVRDSEIKENNVTLRFTPTVGLSSIVLTPASGSAITTALTTADAAAGLKNITGLTGGVKYNAELFQGTKNVGFLSFTTLTPTNYTVKLNPGDDLAAAITAAANGAVIGLNPGTYNVTAASTFITQKTITLKSTSGNPTDTKVNFKEIDIEGTGAGITLAGIEFDGTAGTSLYFLNFIGSQAANGSAATFTNVTVDNCIVHGSTTAFLRADRGTAARDFKIGAITVNNSVVYDMGANGSSNYYMFHLTKMEFANLNVTKSTFYNNGPGLVIASTALTGAAIPSVLITNTTINGFGGNAKYALLDANTNPISFVMRDNIFANTPKSGTVVAAAIRGTGTGSTLTIANNNYFNLVTTVGGTTALTFGTATLTANSSTDLGWTAATTTFTLPVGSPLRTSSSTGGALGDPRWTY